MEIWSIVISSTISVVSIFISNFLGQKATDRKFQLQNMEKSYKEYYVPLMKFLISTNKKNLTYYWLIASWYNAPNGIKITSDPIRTLLGDNLELLPSKVVELIPEYSVATSGAQMFFGDGEYRENYRQSLIKASELFDEIIQTSLKEAKSISQKLGYPDIATTILESFENLEHSESNYPRYLPEIYQTKGPRQYTGEKPPYY